MSGHDNPLVGKFTVHPGQEQSGATNRAVDPTDRPLPIYTYPADFDPASIEPRRWIMKYLLLRNYVTVIVGPGGASKSSFSLVWGISAALGRNLIGYDVTEQTNVLVLNNEDDSTEINRRVAAICQHYGISFADLQGKLHILSGYGESFMVAKKSDDGTVLPTENVQKIVDYCREYAIGFIIIDPLISAHDVEENLNTQMEKVFSQFRYIAKEVGAAVLLIHHTRKATGQSIEDVAGNIDIARGAKALTDGARIAFTLIPMSKKDATERKIEWEIGNRLVRLDDAKKNYSLKNDTETWIYLESIRLPNDDSVGVPTSFNMSEVVEREEAKKAEEKSKKKEGRVCDIAVKVAECMMEDKQPQQEVLVAYMAKNDLKKTAANDAFALLPISKGNAIKVMIEGVLTSVWRERHGNTDRPYYTIHKLAES